MKIKNKNLIIPFIIIGLMVMVSSSCKKDNEIMGTVTDIDGNVYHTITIGTQVWMVENLKTTHYNDGTDLSNVTDDFNWAALETGGYRNYDNEESYAETYGRLYNWYAVESGKLCPTGWHVPTDAEWITLTDFLGGETVAGGKLKEAGTAHWNSPNTDATNTSGFTALPGGCLSYTLTYDNMRNFGYWWTSTAYNSVVVYYRSLYSTRGSINKSYYSKQVGFSVRCIKD